MRHALVWLIVFLIALPAAAQDEPAAPPAAETPATEPTAPAAEPDKPADAEIDQASGGAGQTDRRHRCAEIDLPASRIRGARQRPAGRILRPRDLAGEPLPRQRGRADDPQRQARAGHRAVHAGDRGGAAAAQSVRPDSGAAEVGRVPARPARPVRQSRACGRSLQRRPPPRARVARRHRPDAVGDAQLRFCHHRLDRRAMVQGRRATPPTRSSRAAPTAAC